MKPQDNWGLSEVDCKLLLAFTEELSMDDGLHIAGIKYAYGRKRVGNLKTKGYIQERRVGREILYTTARRAETEYMWQQALSKSTKANGKGFYFRLAGQQMTYQEAMGYISGRHKELKLKATTLQKAMHAIIQALTVVSHKMSKGEPVGIRPQTLHNHLDEWIKHTELTLSFAKALKSHGLLWTESPTVWRSVTFGAEPTDASYEVYEKFVNPRSDDE